MFALIMIVTLEYNNITGTKLEGLIDKYQKRPMNTRTHEQNNCDSGKPGDVDQSNGLIQSCETCPTFTVRICLGCCGLIL